MRLVGLALGLALIGSPASAQYVPRPMVPVGPPAAYDVTEIVEAMGLDPIGPPSRNGAFFVQRATDDYGRVLNVTVDVRRSQVVSVEAGVPRALYGPYAGYAYHHPHPGYPPRYREFDLAPPGSIMVPRGVAPQATLPPRAAPPRARSAAVTPSRPPVPRKRPATAPQEASAGTVEPVAPAPQRSAPAPAPAATSAPAPEKPAGPAMSPVTPLE